MDIKSLAHPGAEKERKNKRRVRVFVRVLIGSCADCGSGGEETTLHPVPKDHLTFFGGDELCGRCAVRHGIL